MEEERLTPWKKFKEMRSGPGQKPIVFDYRVISRCIVALGNGGVAAERR
jgi:hypothetical protein